MVGVQVKQVVDLIWKVVYPVKPLVGQWVGLGGCAFEILLVSMQIGLGEDWAGMTNSSPELSDSLSDSEIGGSYSDAQLVVASFAGNRVSSNFTSWEISMQWWAASQNWYPLVPGS